MLSRINYLSVVVERNLEYLQQENFLKKDNLEVDCILVLSNGDYALIEFKLGSREEDDGASNLIKLKSLINKKRDLGGGK